MIPDGKQGLFAGVGGECFATIWAVANDGEKSKNLHGWASFFSLGGESSGFRVGFGYGVYAGVRAWKLSVSK
jgi:hypothetical protein